MLPLFSKENYRRKPIFFCIQVGITTGEVLHKKLGFYVISFPRYGHIRLKNMHESINSAELPVVLEYVKSFVYNRKVMV